MIRPVVTGWARRLKQDQSPDNGARVAHQRERWAAVLVHRTLRSLRRV